MRRSFVRALADAAFFYDTDRKQPLANRIDGLANVVFQKQLGTLADKAARSAEVAAHIAGQIGGDASRARRATTLAKCDLVTEMVLEFPELQGIMGRYYAQNDGEDPEVARLLRSSTCPASHRMPFLPL